MSQFLWCNIYIQIDKCDEHLSRFLQNNLNFVSHLLDTNGSIKVWHLLKQDYHLNNDTYLQCLQLIISIPEKWKLGIKQNSSDAKNDSVSNIHLINHILLLFKLYIYKSRNKHRLNINELLANILNIKKLEKVTVFGNAKKVAAYNKQKTSLIERG